MRAIDHERKAGYLGAWKAIGMNAQKRERKAWHQIRLRWLQRKIHTVGTAMRSPRTSANDLIVSFGGKPWWI